MSAIPEELMREARVIANERFALGLNVNTVEDLANTIAHALRARDERAARIARDYALHFNNGNYDLIAAAILSNKEQSHAE